MTKRMDKTGRTGDQLFDPAALERMVERFRKHFTSFQDDRYIALERDYKIAAAEKLRERLDVDRLRPLMAANNWDAIREDIRATTHGVSKGQQNNLLNQWDMRALLDTKPERLARMLFNLLYGTDPFPQRFDMWVAALATAKNGVWPAATYFLMLHDPATHIFVKPEPYQKLLNALHSNLAWSTRPTAAAYAEIQTLAQGLFTALRDLGPRDLIDVQSFIYLLYPSNPAHTLPDA